MANCIYIGKPVIRTFKDLWLAEFGRVESLEIRFGITGQAFSEGRKWDFRQHGINISFKVNKKDLKFV